MRALTTVGAFLVFSGRPSRSQTRDSQVRLGTVPRSVHQGPWERLKSCWFCPTEDVCNLRLPPTVHSPHGINVPRTFATCSTKDHAVSGRVAADIQRERCQTGECRSAERCSLDRAAATMAVGGG